MKPTEKLGKTKFSIPTIEKAKPKILLVHQDFVKAQTIVGKMAMAKHIY